MASPWKNMAREIEQLREMGCEVVLSRRNHFRVTLNGRFVGQLPGTPHDPRCGMLSVYAIRRRIRQLQNEGVAT